MFLMRGASKECFYVCNGNVKLTAACTYDRYNRVINKTVIGMGVNQKESHVYTEVWQNRYFRDEQTIEGDDAAPSVASVTLIDPLGRARETSTGDSKVSFTYDKLGNKLSETDALGRVSRWEYDWAGRVVKANNAIGQLITTFYDAIGNKTRVINPEGREILYTYDVVGRLLQQDSPFDESARTQIRYYYDAAGNLLRQKIQINKPGEDILWRENEYRYDMRDRQTDVIMYANAECTKWSRNYCVYDNVGNKLESHTGLTEKESDTPAAMSCTYDRFGNVLVVVDPRSNQLEPSDQLYREERCEYDRIGLLLCKTTTYLYDSFGQLIEESDPDWNTIAYEYDRFGNRSKMTVSGTQKYETTYEYHPNNWLLREEKKTKDAVEIFSYQYDGNGNQCYREWEKHEPAAFPIILFLKWFDYNYLNNKNKTKPLMARAKRVV